MIKPPPRNYCDCVIELIIASVWMLKAYATHVCEGKDLLLDSSTSTFKIMQGFSYLVKSLIVIKKKKCICWA